MKRFLQFAAGLPGNPRPLALLRETRFTLGFRVVPSSGQGGPGLVFVQVLNAVVHVAKKGDLTAFGGLLAGRLNADHRGPG